MPFMQKQIIAYFPEEINPFFKKILDPAAKSPGTSGRKKAMLSSGSFEQILNPARQDAKLHNLSESGNVVM